MIDLIEIDIRGSAKTFTASHSIIMKMITGAKLCLMYYNHPNVHPELQRLKKPKKNCIDLFLKGCHNFIFFYSFN